MASIKKNFIYNTLLNISRIIFPLITAPYVSRVLEPDGVGIYHFAATYAGYFALVALLGVPTYGVREVAKLRNKKEELSQLVSQLFSIVVIATLVVSFTYIISILLITKLRADLLLFILSGFCIYLSPFQTTWFYQGIEEFDFITIRTLVIKTLSVISLFVFVTEKNDLIIYVIISVLGTVLADIWNYWEMRDKGINPKLTTKGLNPHISPIFVLFASSVAVSIYTVLDTIMLGFLSDYTEVGYYSNAMMMSKTFLTIVTSLSVVSIPRFTYYINEGDVDNANTLANRSFSFAGLLAFPLSVGLICLAPILVPWFFGPQYDGTIVPLEILSVLNIAIGFSNILGIQILVGMGKDKVFLRCILYGTVSNFLLNCILIPLFGAVGASIASVIAEFLVTFSMLYYVYKETPIRVLEKGDLLKSIVGTILIIVLFSIFPKMDSGILYIALFTLTSAAVYFISQMILKNNLMTELMETTSKTIIAKISKR